MCVSVFVCARVCVCIIKKGVHSLLDGSPYILRKSSTQLKAGHHLPASETSLKMVFHWRADDGPIMNAGWVA